MTLLQARSAPCLLALAACGVASSAAAQERPSDRTVLGVAAIYAPTYQGADDYRLQPFPVIDISRGRLFLSSRKGAGARVIDGEVVDVSAAVTYMPGYRRRDAPAGIGRLSGGAGARVSADIAIGRAVLGLSATQALSGDVDGALFEASLAMPMRVSSQLFLIPGVSATFADAAYNRAYFGVSPVQAKASRLPAFRPDGGLKDVSASLVANYRLNEKVSLGATVAISRLAGDAKASPLVVRKTQPVFFLSAAYAF